MHVTCAQGSKCNSGIINPDPNPRRSSYIMRQSIDAKVDTFEKSYKAGN